MWEEGCIVRIRMKQGQFCMNDYCKLCACLSVSVHLQIFDRSLRAWAQSLSVLFFCYCS